MNIFLQERPEDLYFRFKIIRDDAYQAIISFWDTYHDDLYVLSLQEYFDVLISYCNALFELDKSEEYLIAADEALEVIFDNNIYRFQNLDILTHILFRKATCHYRLLQFDQALHCLAEIQGINPHLKEASAFYEQIHIKVLRRRYWKIQKIAGLIFLITLTGIYLNDYAGLHFLSVQHGGFLHQVLSLCTVMSGSIFTGFEVYYLWKMKQYVHRLKSEVQSRRAKKSKVWHEEVG